MSQCSFLLPYSTSCWTSCFHHLSQWYVKNMTCLAILYMKCFWHICVCWVVADAGRGHHDNWTHYGHHNNVDLQDNEQCRTNASIQTSKRTGCVLEISMSVQLVWIQCGLCEFQNRTTWKKLHLSCMLSKATMKQENYVRITDALKSWSVHSMLLLYEFFHSSFISCFSFRGSVVSLDFSSKAYVTDSGTGRAKARFLWLITAVIRLKPSPHPTKSHDCKQFHSVTYCWPQANSILPALTLSAMLRACTLGLCNSPLLSYLISMCNPVAEQDVRCIPYLFMRVPKKLPRKECGFIQSVWCPLESKESLTL